MPGPRLPPGPPPGPLATQTAPSPALAQAPKARAAATSQAPRASVVLSVLDANYLEYQQGELFSSISAGFGRYDCDKLLKPSGVELLDLRKTANIEVSVHRRVLPTPGSLPQNQQPLYKGYISLAQVLGSSKGPREGQPGASVEAVTVFEDWLGLIGANEMSPHAQSADQLFQFCLEIGKPSSLRPKLFIRLQYLPMGVTVTAVPRVERTPTQQVRAPHPVPPTHLQAVPDPRPDLRVQAYPAIPGHDHGPYVQGPSGPLSELEVLRQRVRALEKENNELKADRSIRDTVEKDVTNQVGQLVQRLGISPSALPGDGRQLPITQASMTLQEVSAKVAEMTLQDGDGSAKGAVCNSFYRPVISDAVDCLVAATLLRLGFAEPEQLVRLGPGHYQLGEVGKRLYCRIDKGRLLTQPEDPHRAPDEELPPPVEFSKFISDLVAGQSDADTDSKAEK